MDIAVPVYEERFGSRLAWTTLGLGEANQHLEGPSAAKVRKNLIRRLRIALESCTPATLQHLNFGQRRDLAICRAEFTPTGGRRAKVSGQFPFILEPRWANDAQKVTIAYHPHRQANWFAVDPDRELDDQARLFLRQTLTDVSDEAVERLKVTSRPRLLVVSLRIQETTLLQQVRKRREDRNKALADASGGAFAGGDLDILSEVGVNETQRAADDSLSGGMPRSPYREQLQQLLSDPATRRSVLVVGPAGVGKTTLIGQWVHDQLDADGYRSHFNLDKCHQVWRISGRRIIAGMSYVGQWEERCVALVQAARRQKVILQIDDLHAFGSIGQSRQSDRNLADLFRGPVARGEVTFVAECTPTQLQRLEDEAPALASAFDRVFVEETTGSETMTMLLHEARSFELALDLELEPMVLKTILEVGGSLFSHAALPGSALELLQGLATRHEGTAELPGRPGVADVIAHLSERSGIPTALLRPDIALDAREVNRDLSNHVMGQPEAILAAEHLILTIKAGLDDPRRPYGVHLFTGPTGTGKTELAKTLAAYLYGNERRLLRFDMSEFSGSDAPARLIGDRFDPKGLLTTRVREQPFSVVLLDEIEKAHPSVLSLLLQLFDEGRLTDASGNVADFTHAVVIMTSNLGASNRAHIGFGETRAQVMQDISAAVERFFPPELFNRIDRVVAFGPLTPKVSRTIARKELDGLVQRRGLLDRSAFVYSTESVLDMIVERGFDSRDGARALKRTLDRVIGDLLSHEIASTAGATLRIIRLYMRPDGTPDLHVEALREVEPLPEVPSLPWHEHDSAGRLSAYVLEALTDISHALNSPALVQLKAQLKNQLAALRLEGNQGALGEGLFWLDEAQQHLLSLRDELDLHAQALLSDDPERIEAEQFGRVRDYGADSWSPRTVRVYDRRVSAPSLPAVGREDLLDRFAEVAYAPRYLKLAIDPSQHDAFLVLAQVGPQLPQQQRFGPPRLGLIGWLAEAYALLHGNFTGFAVRSSDGRDDSGANIEDLQFALHQAPTHVVLRVEGLCILDRFRAEEGCHLRFGDDGRSEVVRVSTQSAGSTTEENARAILLAHMQASKQFADALERADSDLPPDPNGLLPVIRRYEYEPTSRAHSRALVEDFALSQVIERPVRDLLDVLRPLARIHAVRLGRHAEVP